MTERLHGHFIDDGESLPKALAELFAQMTADNQALFFDEVAKIVATWPAHADFQWRAMEKWLTPEAKRIINGMKEHTE